MKTILLSFRDEKERDQFVNVIQAIDGLKTLVDTLVFDPQLKEPIKSCSIWVAGSKLAEGEKPEMKRMFDQECAAHSATVVMKEMREGKWCEISARRHQ